VGVHARRACILREAHERGILEARMADLQRMAQRARPDLRG